MKLQPAGVVLLAAPLLAAAAVAWLAGPGPGPMQAPGGEKAEVVPAGVLAGSWAEFSARRRGKVVFARPPKMFCLDLAAVAA